MDDVVRYVWGEYRAWAATSRRLKQRLTTGGAIVLGLTLGGTALATLTPLLPESNGLRAVLPWLAAVALGIATYLTNQLLSDSERQSWLQARAVAEALKSEAHKYVTGTAPYDVPLAAQVLGQQAAKLQQTLPGILADQISDDERAKHVPDRAWTAADYAEKRVREQITFYRGAITKHRNAVRTARILALGFGIIAVALTAAGTTLGSWPPALVGVVTTAAAAIGAWFQGGHHQQLALSYQAAVAKLELLLAQFRSSGIPGPQLISDAEAIFQSEHAAWLMEWRQPTAPAAAAVTSESRSTAGS